MNRWAWGWVALLLAVLGYELAAIASPGEDDTLTYHVTRLIYEYPETAGAAVFLLLAWLIYHWFIARKTWNEGGGRGD